VYDLQGTELNFVHKRIFGAAKGFIGGGFTGAASGFIGGGGGGGSRRGATGPEMFTINRRGERVLKKAFRSKGITAGTACVFPARPDPITGRCKLFLGDQPGPEPGGVGGGGAVMGRFGAALVPDVEDVVTMRCLPGMVLGKMEADGGHLCYNRKDLTNKERLWPRGRRPLGTPGEMAALAKAASFGRRMEGTVKRMQKIGVLKKPSRARPRARAPKQIGPGGPSIINVE